MCPEIIPSPMSSFMLPLNCHYNKLSFVVKVGGLIISLTPVAWSPYLWFCPFLRPPNRSLAPSPIISQLSFDILNIGFVPSLGTLSQEVQRSRILHFGFLSSLKAFIWKAFMPLSCFFPGDTVNDPIYIIRLSPVLLPPQLYSCHNTSNFFKIELALFEVDTLTSKLVRYLPDKKQKPTIRDYTTFPK